MSVRKLLRRSILAPTKRLGFVATSGIAVLALTVGFQSNIVAAHGDITPQAVDASKLKAVGKEWLDTNPYRGDKAAVEVGASGYNQNCARCHGLEAVSGGVAPDLRKLEADCGSLKDEKKRVACGAEVDNYYMQTVRRGRTRNGAVYMPPFEHVMSQEAVWAIKTYFETRRTE